LPVTILHRMDGEGPAEHGSWSSSSSRTSLRDSTWQTNQPINPRTFVNGPNTTKHQCHTWQVMFTVLESKDVEGVRCMQNGSLQSASLPLVLAGFREGSSCQTEDGQCNRWRFRNVDKFMQASSSSRASDAMGALPLARGTNSVSERSMLLERCSSTVNKRRPNSLGGLDTMALTFDTALRRAAVGITTSASTRTQSQPRDVLSVRSARSAWPLLQTAVQGACDSYKKEIQTFWNAIAELKGLPNARTCFATLWQRNASTRKRADRLPGSMHNEKCCGTCIGTVTMACERRALRWIQCSHPWCR